MVAIWGAMTVTVLTVAHIDRTCIIAGFTALPFPSMVNGLRVDVHDTRACLFQSSRGRFPILFNHRSFRKPIAVFPGFLEVF